MHEITGNRESVLRLLKDTIHHFGMDLPKSKSARMKSLGVKNDTQWSHQRDQIIQILKNGYNQEQPKELVGIRGIIPNERAIDSWYSPRNRVVALFQSAMEEFLEDHLARLAPKSKKMGLKAPTQLTVTVDIFYKTPPATKGSRNVKELGEQFSPIDPGWAEVAWEKLKILLKGNHKFISHKSPTDFCFPMDDEVTIAIVGDWGGGNNAAQEVAAQIKNCSPDYVIHLGDVYYAGTEREVQNRFLNYWPAPDAPGRSFALNSNHEMYSGGYGYFDITLKQFKQPASYFSLSNKNWRFIGLDTGYVDHDLNKEQVDWLTAQFKGKNPKTILLSHHQLFSAYEKTDADNLMHKVQPFINANKIYGWFWGHEHLAVIYKEYMGIKARCIGNGCFPYKPPTNTPQIPVEWLNDRLQPSNDSYRGIHTFALLKIRGDAIDVEYIDQDGTVWKTENWS